LTSQLGKVYTVKVVLTRGGAVAARRAHNPKVVGSNPTPATKIQLQNPLKTSPKLSPNEHKVFTKDQQLFTSQLLLAFLKSRANGLSPRTILDYEWRLKRFIGYPITPDGIKSFLDNLSCSNGKWNYFKCIRAISNWLFKNGYTKDNAIILVEAPKRQKKLLPAITEAQYHTLLNQCPERDNAIISLLWHSGMRVSEAANVKAKDFDWMEGTVTVLGKGNRYRKCLCGDGIVKAWFNNNDSFGLDASGIQTMLKRLALKTGIKCNPHSFRRGFAVHNVKSGLSTRVVQTLGGWTTLSMVERYSASLTFEDALKTVHNNRGNSPIV
jgi:site-specific recombinase XerD